MAVRSIIRYSIKKGGLGVAFFDVPIRSYDVQLRYQPEFPEKM
jgi:hypothetical protein